MTVRSASSGDSSRNDIAQISYEEWANLSDEERASTMETLVEGMSEADREEFLQNLAEECNSDAEDYEERIDDLIERLRERIREARRARDNATVEEALAFIDDLRAEEERWDESPESLQQTAREALENYEDTHKVATDGSTVVINGADLEEATMEYQVGGRPVARNIFEEEPTYTERLIEQGYLTDDHELAQKPNSEEFYTQEDIDRALDQMRQAKLAERQQIELRAGPGQSLSLVSGDDATGNYVFRFTDSDGTTHDVTFTGATDCIFVFTGGLDAGDFDAIRSWGNGLTSRCHWKNSDGSLSDSFYDYLGTSRDPNNKEAGKLAEKFGPGGANKYGSINGPREPTPQYHPEGHDELLEAYDAYPDFDDEFFTPPELRAEFDRAVERLLEANEDTITEVWDDILNHCPENLKADLIKRLTVVCLMEAPEKMRTLLGPVAGLLGEIVSGATVGGLTTSERMVKIILEALASGDTEAVSAHFTRLDENGHPTAGDWPNHEGNIEALTMLKTLMVENFQTFPPEIQTFLDNEQAYVDFVAENAGFEPEEIRITDQVLGQIIDQIDDIASLFDGDGHDTSFNGIRSAVIDFFTRLNAAGPMSLQDMRDFIGSYFVDATGRHTQGGYEDNMATAIVCILHALSPGLFDALRSGPQGEIWRGFMHSLIYNGGGDFNPHPPYAADADRYLYSFFSSQP